jgi:hypothetical protein
MRRILVLLFALAFLPTLCLAGSIDNFDVTTYQINITATWIATNPLCALNCTETMNISYRFESNLDVFNPNSSTDGIYGWVEMNTVQESSSGFMGSFTFRPNYPPASGLWEDDGAPSADGLPFYNVFNGSPTDEIDIGVMGPGLSGRGGPDMLIYDCFTESCQSSYPGIPGEDIRANTESSTAVQLPAGDSAWELVLVMAIVCTIGLFVKHRLGLTPSR